jgi:predicted DNA-binding transcriptional regulator AlpA
LQRAFFTLKGNRSDHATHPRSAVVRTKVPPNDKEYLSQAEAAEFLGFHANTMVKLAGTGDGPPRIKIGPRLVRYRRAELVAWMESRKEVAR